MSRVILGLFLVLLASCGRNSPKLEYSNAADIGICTVDLRGEADLYEIAEEARYCQRKLTSICGSKLTINESVFLEQTKEYASFIAFCYLVRKKVDCCADNSEVFVMNEYWFNHYKKTCTRYCAVFGDNYKFDSIRIIKEDRKKIRETCECSTTKGAATWYKYIDIVDQS